MIISEMRTSFTDGNVKLSVNVESVNKDKKELWFSIHRKHQDGICDTNYDGFLVGLLYPAMRQGENIHVKGTVSKKLLFNINNYVIPLIKSFSSKCETIQVTASQLTSDCFHGRHTGTGFSGGIDSFCTIYDRFYLEKDPEFRINKLFFLNVGAHGSVNEQAVKEKFMIRYDYLKAFPNEVGLEFIPIDSNLFLFHPWGHELTSTLNSVSGILTMQKNIKRYYLASSGLDYVAMFDYSKKYRDVAIASYCDPIILPLLGTESTEFISDGVQYIRVEKTARILCYEPVHRYLNVCTSSEATHKNCSVCNKCARTLMTLNSLNELDNFHYLFDIDKYKKYAEKKYVRQQVAMQKKDFNAKQNVELAKSNNIKLPNYTYCVLIQSIKEMLRKIYFRLPKFFPAPLVERIRESIGKFN